MCDHRWCGFCGEDVHGDDASECAQLRALRANMEWQKGNTRKCPGCAIPTEHAGGCTHMTCAQCKFSWCWACGGPYKNRYSFDLNRCPCDDPDSEEEEDEMNMGLFD